MLLNMTSYHAFLSTHLADDGADLFSLLDSHSLSEGLVEAFSSSKFTASCLFFSDNIERLLIYCSVNL